MRSLLLLSILCLSYIECNAQDSTINRLSIEGNKTGHWIYLGKDRPEMNYPPEGKIEEGNYVDNRKDGIWIKYYNDGKTPRLRATYKNNRPTGRYWKISPEGWTLESGTFRRVKSTELDTVYAYDKFGRVTKSSIRQGYHDLLTDSSFYYLNSGCLDSILVINHLEESISVLRFSKATCDSILSKLEYQLANVPPIIEPSEGYGKGNNQQTTIEKGQVYNRNGRPLIPTITNDSNIKTSVHPIYRIDANSIGNDKKWLLEIYEFDNESQKELKHIIYTKGCTVKASGYNKVYNENGEIFLNGNFENYQLWDGKAYTYDEDGILLRVKVYKDGEYHSDDQL